MEELAGIREAGLSLTESALTHPLEWECATDRAGITLGWNLPDCQTQGWPGGRRGAMEYNPKVNQTDCLPGIVLNLNFLPDRQEYGFPGLHVFRLPETDLCGLTDITSDVIGKRVLKGNSSYLNAG